MTHWQKYLDIIRAEDDLPPSLTRLLTIYTTTTTTAASAAAASAPETAQPSADAAASTTASTTDEPMLRNEQEVQRDAYAHYEQNEQNEQSLPERAEPSRDALSMFTQSLPPAAADAARPAAADVAGEMGMPPADVAALPAHPAAAARLPANWRETMDPRAYQPRPFGPMETDPDWPGDPDEEGDEPDDEPAAGDRSAGVSPARPGGADGRSAGVSPARPGGAGSLAGLPIRQVDARGGLAIAPPSGTLAPEPEDVCWLCEDAAELYDPSGRAWCSLCVEHPSDSYGWQDLIDLLPATWQRHADSNRQLAVYAAAHYHEAGRRRITLRWSQPPFHQPLQGADLFRAIAAWLAAPERWKQREAERQLEHLVEHEGRDCR